MLPQWASLPGYAIQAQIDLTTLTVRGQQRVVYTNHYTQTLDELYFHLYPNAPRFGKSMTVDGLTVNAQASQVLYEKERRVLRVPLDPPLLPGRQAVIEMEFTTVITAMAKSDLRSLVYSKGILSLEGWHPMLAVWDGAGWHLDYHPGDIGEAVFADAAFYTVELVAPAGLVFAATGTAVGDRLREDGLREWRFVGGPLRSFALIGASDYQVVSGQAGEVVVRSYYRGEDEKCGRWSLEAAQAALELYGRLYGPYPFSEFEVVAADYAFQGMEFSGMIAVGEGLYQVDPACGEWFVAHETAHQWWYAAVGSDPVNHPWLDEALAQFSTMTYFRRLWGADSARAYINAIIYDKFAPFANHPAGVYIDRPVTDFESTKDYYAIVYARGAMFMDELNKLLGDQAFFDAMQCYYRQNLFGIARPQDLYAAFVEAQVKTDEIKEMWEGWVIGK